jgi:Na+/H+ antiporter NhaC
MKFFRLVLPAVFLLFLPALSARAHAAADTVPVAADTTAHVHSTGMDSAAAADSSTVDHHTATDAPPIQADAKKGTWISIIPPLVAIAISLAFKQVLLALFFSIWTGVFLAGNITFQQAFVSFFESVTEYIMPALAEPDHASIVMFSLLIGGMIGIVQANGGTQGIIALMSRFVKNRRDGQVMTTLLGFVVFFDDYANTMIVGNTMRPLVDKLRITRAKLAYLVDSTSAPVATVALVSTWIGAMVAYIADAERTIPNFTEAAYLVFVNSLSYNFYAWLTIIFVTFISFSRKDFGPMLESRKKLLRGSADPLQDQYGIFQKNEAADASLQKTSHWFNAVLPIAVLVIGTLTGLWVTGEGNTIQEIIGSSNSYSALLWASSAALATASAMTIVQRLLPVHDMLKGMNRGMFGMFEGAMILVMAWSLSSVTKTLGTADFLVTVFSDSLNPFWIPAIVFVLAGITAFSTGTSWGTMGILMPLVIPLIWNICQGLGLPYETAHDLIYGAVASVLAGSVLGDHCSPISDTTILSSISSQCDHVEHVNTQMPYALVVGAISFLCLVGQFVLGLPTWILYAVSASAIFGIIWYFGRDPERDDPEFAALAKAMDDRDRLDAARA